MTGPHGLKRLVSSASQAAPIRSLPSQTKRKCDVYVSDSITGAAYYGHSGTNDDDHKNCRNWGPWYAACAKRFRGLDEHWNLSDYFAIELLGMSVLSTVLDNFI